MSNLSTIIGFGGVQLAVESWGDPEALPVLLVHGVGQTRGSWRRTAENLAAAGRYALAFDLRGHGSSETPTDGCYSVDAWVGDIHAVMAPLQQRPVLVGASAGGWMAAIAVGEAAPHISAGLVMVDGAPWLEAVASERLLAQLRDYAQGFASIEAAAATAADLHPLRALSAESIRQGLVEGEDGLLYWRWDARLLQAIDLSAAAARFEGVLPRLDLPLLNISGEMNKLISPTAAGRISKLAPGCEQVAIPEAGHLSVSEQGDAFDALLLEFLERRVPQAPPIYESGSDPRTLRQALGCFATGVTVVAALDQLGQPVGLTANSMTSVSLDPPLLLVCIARSAGSLPAIEAADHFSVNVLHIGQQPTSDRFARRQEDRFAATTHEIWNEQIPIISHSLASFACARHAVHDGGDHVILVGRVLRVLFEPQRDPLLYFRGKYRRLHFS